MTLRRQMQAAVGRSRCAARQGTGTCKGPVAGRKMGGKEGLQGWSTETKREYEKVSRTRLGSGTQETMYFPIHFSEKKRHPKSVQLGLPSPNYLQNGKIVPSTVGLSWRLNEIGKALGSVPATAL